jgi:RHS repeat-associated protein
MPAAGYQGDYTDAVTGLVFMNARWYNPANGTFVSSDKVNGSPIPSTMDGDPYAYASGNPLTQIDPTGHGLCFLCGVESVANGIKDANCWLYPYVCNYLGQLDPHPSAATLEPYCIGGASLYECGTGSSLPPPPVYTCLGAERCGSPAPSWYPPPPSAPYPTGQAPPSCSWNCVVGIGVFGTIAFCAQNPELCASVFKPPPPPQNCYAAGECTPPNASNAFKDESHITESKTPDAKNPKDIPKSKTIIQQTPKVTENPKGLTASEGDTTANDASNQTGTGNGADKTGLSRLQKIAANSAIGGGGSVLNDLAHGVHGWQRYLEDWGVGSVLGSFGGMNDTWWWALVSGGGAGSANSAYSQWRTAGTVNPWQTVADGGLSMITAELGWGAGQWKGNFEVPLNQGLKDANSIFVSIQTNLLSNTCDPNNLITNGAAC